MHRSLRTTAARTTLALALAGGAAAVLVVPSGASAEPSHRKPAHVAPVTSDQGTVEIGTAVAYERMADGSIRQVR